MSYKYYDNYYGTTDIINTIVNVFDEEPHLRTVESGHVSKMILVLLSIFMIDS